MNTEMTTVLSNVVASRFSDYLAKPLESAGGATRIGTLKTGGTANAHLRFGLEVCADDRSLRFLGAGLPPANPNAAPLFILRRLSDEQARFYGVALRQRSTGGISVEQVCFASDAGEFNVAADVLEQFLARGIAATAFVGALGLYTNCCDAGLDHTLARNLARDAFAIYMNLFEEFGVAGFFSDGPEGGDGSNSGE